jgi:hypothetical protein
MKRRRAERAGNPAENKCDLYSADLMSRRSARTMTDVTRHETAAASLPDCVHKTVEVLVQRAKTDKAGVYWQLGTIQRAGEAARKEITLGQGSPGILLTLIEYHRATGDRDVRELLSRGLAWLEQRAGAGGFAEGFFDGSGGLWHLYREAETVFPGWNEGWRARALAAMRQAAIQPGAGIESGCAGTMIGLLACLRRDVPAEVDAMLTVGRNRLLAYAGVAEEGLFWDCDPTSLQPSLGFLSGNAGIEYCLAHLGAHRGERFTAAMLGSLARARAAFVPGRGNWPDFDVSFTRLPMDQAGMEKLLDRADRGDELKEEPEFSLGWGGGAAGIFLARSALTDAAGGEPVGEMARGDADRALDAIEAASDATWVQTDQSLRHRLGERAARLATMMEARLRERPAATGGDDLSLLTGLSGQTYAILALRRGGVSCIDPLQAVGLEPVPSAAPDVDPRILLQLRMPGCAGLEEVGSVFLEQPMTLRALGAQAETGAAEKSPLVVRRRRRFEIERQRALARTNFRRRLWEELAAKRRYARNYGEVMDEEILFGRFRLDASVALVEVDFDPVRNVVLEGRERSQLLRQQGSKGLFERPLTPLQASLLRGFAPGALTVEVIDRVIKRVQPGSSNPPQLSALALKTIREWIERGVLFPIPSNPVKGWWVRRQWRGTRETLFPVSIS